VDEPAARTNGRRQEICLARADYPQNWASLAAELARCSDVVPRLLAEHRDDGNGRCAGCRLPGYGSPGAGRHPCVLRTLAELAQRPAHDHRR
jgi:hypothetical protein